MTPREDEEYRALRATIRERGTARVWVFVAALTAWAALAIASSVAMSTPLAALLPLVVLAGGFEAVFALHTGVERIGRYVQVFYEGDVGDPGSTRQWEHIAMASGRTAPPRPSPDPLFAAVFCLATLCNLVPVVAIGPIPVEWGAVGFAHLAFLVRLFVARRQAQGQRARDLERFQALKTGGTGVRESK